MPKRHQGPGSAEAALLAHQSGDLGHFNFGWRAEGNAGYLCIYIYMYLYIFILIYIYLYIYVGVASKHTLAFWCDPACRHRVYRSSAMFQTRRGGTSFEDPKLVDQLSFVQTWRPSSTSAQSAKRGGRTTLRLEKETLFRRSETHAQSKLKLFELSSTKAQATHNTTQGCLFVQLLFLLIHIRHSFVGGEASVLSPAGMRS